MEMNVMATRMSIISRALPTRILLVDDDGPALAAMTERLALAGFEVEAALNGQEALQRFERQWFPVVIADWQMPVMDAITMTERLRARGVDDTYVIVLTIGESAQDYEHGYLSGVDDYLAKQTHDAELMARIHAAFNTLALRRSLKETRMTLREVTPIDADSGAFNVRETLTKLTAELTRAQRYGRLLSIVTIGVHADTKANPVRSDMLSRVVSGCQKIVRADIDWVGRLQPSVGTVAFVIVLPEAGPSDGPAIKGRLNGVLQTFAQDMNEGSLAFDFGFASLDRSSGDGKVVSAEELLGVAEQCRACPGQSGTAQLSTVQRSVASHVAIACRHGYAVDSFCSLKSEQPLVDRRPSPVSSPLTRN